jgi:hypothetical protein
MTMSDPKQTKTVTDKGKYLTVYRKQADGTWKAVADMINSDLALAPPVTERSAKTVPRAVTAPPLDKPPSDVKGHMPDKCLGAEAETVQAEKLSLPSCCPLGSIPA